MTKLVIIRHGNTFAPGETPRRVGGRTDLPLVDSGLEQGAALGRHFKEQGLYPDAVFTSSLQRTQQTAQEIVKAMAINIEMQASDIFDEIDYGPDEDKPENEVVARLGEAAIQKWNEEAVVPDGWRFDPDQATKNWQDFADHMANTSSGKTVFVVTSNGIARFAPILTGDFDAFRQRHNLKLHTGAYGVLCYGESGWDVEAWNVRPR
jgi:probable phosphoglycerate mutase